MSLRTCLLGFAGMAVLVLAGCGPNKGAEKGTDDKLKIETKAGGVSTRPAIPSKAEKTGGKTTPNSFGSPAGKGPPPVPVKK